MTHAFGKPHQTVLPEVDVEHLPQCEHVLSVASVLNIILYPPFVFKVASSVINTEHYPPQMEFKLHCGQLCTVFFSSFFL